MILPDTFVKCICRNISCALGKCSLHSRWNVIPTFTEFRVHGDERWPMEVTYFRSVVRSWHTLFYLAVTSIIFYQTWTRSQKVQYLATKSLFSGICHNLTRAHCERSFPRVAWSWWRPLTYGSDVKYFSVVEHYLPCVHITPAVFRQLEHLTRLWWRHWYSERSSPRQSTPDMSMRR